MVVLINSLMHRLGNHVSNALFGPRLLVCIALFCLSGVLISAYALGYVWLVAIGLIGLLVGSLAGKKYLTILFIVLPSLSAWYCGLRIPIPLDNDISKLIVSGKVVFTGQILEISKNKSGDSTSLTLTAEQMSFPTNTNLDGKIKVTVYGANYEFQEGDIVRVGGIVSQPQCKYYPWQFDYAKFLAKENVFLVCNAHYIQIVDHQQIDQNKCIAKLTNWIDSLRNKMSALHRENLGKSYGDLLTSIVLGNRAVTLSDSVNQKYRDVGLSHVLAASGFNISLAVAMMWWLSNKLMRNLWFKTGLCWLATMLYVCLAGASPSVVRAAIMITLALVVKCLFRSLYTPAALALALLVSLIIDPLSVLDVGLQLSYLATFGIVCGASSIDLKMHERIIPNWLAEPLLMVLLAEASVLPVQLGVFWQMGLFFLPANLLVDPLVPMITILGFMSSLAPLLDGGTNILNLPAGLIDHIAWYPLQLMTMIVDFFSSLPNAKFLSRPPIMLAVIVYFLALILMLGCLHLRRFRTIAFFVWVASACGLLWHPALPVLTIGAFPDAVVIMDRQQRMYRQGDASHSDAGRFISFFGGRNLNDVNLFAKRQIGALTIISFKSFKIALFDLDDKTKFDYDSLPNYKCQVMIIHHRFRDAIYHSNNQETMNTDLLDIKMIANKLQTQWIMIDIKDWQNRLALSLSRKLSSIQGLHILKISNGAAVLVAQQRDGKMIFTPSIGNDLDL